MKQHFDSDYDEVYQFELLEDFMKLVFNKNLAIAKLYSYNNN